MKIRQTQSDQIKESGNQETKVIMIKREQRWNGTPVRLKEAKLQEKERESENEYDQEGTYKKYIENGK